MKFLARGFRLVIFVLAHSGFEVHKKENRIYLSKMDVLTIPKWVVDPSNPNAQLGS